jgi:peptide/nickel transport system permease protein
MVRWTLRILSIPLILCLVHAFGYWLALFIRYQNAVRASPIDLIPPPPDYFGLYLAYVSELLRGNLGVLPYGRPVPISEVIAEAAVASFGLLLIVFVISVLAGLLLGRLAVSHDPPRIAFWLTSISTIGLATPAFFLGSLFLSAIVLLAIYGPFDPSNFPIPFGGYGWDRHLILPVTVLALLPIARLAQVSATLLTDELQRPYITVTRSVGHGWARIRNRYAFRNIVAPVVIAISGSLRLLVAELIIVERLFNWPGLGQWLSRTLVPSLTPETFLYPPLLAILLTIFAALFLIADLIADMLVASVDPRQRVA